MSAVSAPSYTSQIESLCAAIAADPDVIAAREDAETFLANEQAVALYRDVVTLGRSLDQRQRSGAELEEADIIRFQELQARADADEDIAAFMTAQNVLQNVANVVNGFVTKTLEKGRVPTSEEVFGPEQAGGGGCGEGCGCH